MFQLLQFTEPILINGTLTGFFSTNKWCFTVLNGLSCLQNQPLSTTKKEMSKTQKFKTILTSLFCLAELLTANLLDEVSLRHSCSCGRSYTYKADLVRHRRLECGIEPQFQCPHCDKKCKRKYHLMTHLVNKHRDKLSPTSW